MLLSRFVWNMHPICFWNEAYLLPFSRLEVARLIGTNKATQVTVEEG